MPPADDAAVTYDRVGEVGVLRMRRADRRNTMTGELLAAFAAALAAARADDPRVVVVTGDGAYFSAGADLDGPLQIDAGGGHTPAERSFMLYAPFLGVLELEVPVIAAMNGHAVGGGFGLALACDIRIAARRARYGANFCRLGLAPGMGISYLLPRVIGAARAAEMIFGAELIDGDRAAAIGLCAEALEAHEVLPRAMALATRIAENAPLAVRASKALLREALGWRVVAHAGLEAARQAETLASADAAEGVRALLEKRPPVFRGA
jgi:enoyl-CoA hydratase/carnithine racemase